MQTSRTRADLSLMWQNPRGFMRKLLVFQHSAREPLGVLDPMLRRAGFRIRYLNFSRQPDQKVDVRRYNGLVVLGGPMNVDQQDRYPHLTTEIAAIQEALDHDIPILGICLGAQLLAAALGANVRPNSVREIGWYHLEPTAKASTDPLCRHLDGRNHVLQWHAYTFDLPPGAVHLASSPTCPNQAFRYGDRAYGLQFHLEADLPLIKRWLHVPEYRSEAEASGPEHHLEHILRDSHVHAPQSLTLSERVFGEFIELTGWRRRTRLGSL
jgi:GMP synthase (glutamine-hydrolysing)